MKILSVRMLIEGMPKMDRTHYWYRCGKTYQGESQASTDFKNSTSLAEACLCSIMGRGLVNTRMLKHQTVLSLNVRSSQARHLRSNDYPITTCIRCITRLTNIKSKNMHLRITFTK